MRTRVWVAGAVAVAVLGAGAAVMFRSAAVDQVAGAAQSGGRARGHTVRASESGSGRSASMVVTDPYAAGSKLVKVEYHLHDGYTKRVIIPGGAYVLTEDIAICGTAGRRYPDNGFTGTGLECKPFLHPTEVLYRQNVGDLAGRRSPHRNVEVTEVARGHGRYLTFGHIDHGTLLSVEYYWANGEHLTVDMHGDVLVDHIRVITIGGHLSAVATRHP